MTPHIHKTDISWLFKTPNKESLQMESFFMGIDVSKGYADFVIIDGRKKPVIKNFQLDDTFDGHSSLYEVLRQFVADHRKATVFAAMESTGGYENNWYKALISFQASLPIQTARLNPLAVVHSAKADLKRNKTDKISAQSVAEYLVAHPEKVIYQQHDELASLRKQWGFIRMLTKQCTQLYNQLNSLLYTACPELLRFCQDGMPAWLLTLLLHYPCAAQLKKARPKTLAKIPYITKERAQKLIADAKISVASATDAVTAQLVSAVAAQILQMKKTIAAQTQVLTSQCQLPQLELLTTFPGIGDVSAIGLLLEIQSVARFKSVKKLASFFGLHPVLKISGDGCSAFKMSKMGRIEPRRILFNVALSAIQYNPVIKAVYEHHLAQGKHKMAAIGVCMHKILRIVYGMLKNNTAFDPKIDQANTNKHRPTAKTADLPLDKNRRFQDFDPKAPVSRRQRSKRMERKPSQSVNNTQCGISAPVPLGTIIANVMANL